MDLMGKNFQYIKHPKNVYAKFHAYLFVGFLCHINEYFKVLFQLILLVAQYKYDCHFMSHLAVAGHCGSTGGQVSLTNKNFLINTEFYMKK